MTDKDAALKSGILTKYAELSAHPVFSSLNTIEDLRLFMQFHVFAVWDFMLLLKRLQREFTGIALPWTPPVNRLAARHINEIVLAEESDKAPSGAFMSHFELYITAMREVGADTSQVEEFINLLRGGTSIEAALVDVGADPLVQRFVNATANTAMSGKLTEVLGSFFYGRENVIPLMFSGLLAQWRFDEGNAPVFVFYLKRHIELDADRHGPLADAIIKAHVHDDARMTELFVAAADAVSERRMFWDGVLARIEERRG